jgi:hypothetical protein
MHTGILYFKFIQELLAIFIYLQEADPLEADSADSQSIPRKEKFHKIIWPSFSVIFEHI